MTRNTRYRCALAKATVNEVRLVIYQYAFLRINCAYNIIMMKNLRINRKKLHRVVLRPRTFPTGQKYIQKAGGAVPLKGLCHQFRID